MLTPFPVGEFVDYYKKDEHCNSAYVFISLRPLSILPSSSLLSHPGTSKLLSF